MKNSVFAIQVFIFVLAGYPGFALTVFQYRNPLANNMSFFRDFSDVMKFRKLDKYQLSD